MYRPPAASTQGVQRVDVPAPLQTPRTVSFSRVRSQQQRRSSELQHSTAGQWRRRTEGIGETESGG